MHLTKYSVHRNKIKGFTLVELLVVIAIISVLAGMLLPALENAISSARQVSCMNNLRQVGFYVRDYAQSYNDYMLSSLYPTVPELLFGMPIPAQSYLTSQSLPTYIDLSSDTDSKSHPYYCPAYGAKYSKSLFGASYPYTYTSNGNAGQIDAISGAPIEGGDLKRFCEFKLYSKNAFIGDGQERNGNQVWHCRDYILSDIGIHNDKSNYLFFDGHVESRFVIIVVGPVGFFTEQYFWQKWDDPAIE